MGGGKSFERWRTNSKRGVPSLELDLRYGVVKLGEVVHHGEGDSPFSKRLLSSLYFYIRKLSFHEIELGIV